MFRTVICSLLAILAAPAVAGAVDGAPGAAAYAPPFWAALPFAALLLAIAVFPLVKPLRHFWERNANKLLIALALSLPVGLYYLLGHPAGTSHEPQVPAGWAMLGAMLQHALIAEYFPFIVLLLSLYTISGGISLRGDLPAHPRTNTIFLAVGAVLANVIGTTGAAMLLIRPLLQTNQERKHVRHTVIFFVFLVCNIGGCLTPLADPPLFLGYLKGVPFAWTLRLAPEWAMATVILLVVYYFWDLRAWRKEGPADVVRDEARVKPLRIRGLVNLIYLAVVVASVAVLVPGRALWGGLVVPDYLREGVMLAATALSLLTTPRLARQENQFNFTAMAEVAALFLGIFITMQAPIEMLQVKGAELGLTRPWHFFWATGALSSFLDNAPTYVVFLETASAVSGSAPGSLTLANGGTIGADLLAAVSLGAVFMGAMTYIGNGPNFMVKAIAEQNGVKMPGFFGYMAYSVCVLVPLFVLVTLVFFAFA